MKKILNYLIKNKRIWQIIYIMLAIIVFVCIVFPALFPADNIVLYFIIRLAVIPFILLIHLGYYGFKKMMKKCRT
ncbi:hypothetical protein B1757_12615 [Acidithiobacillus marinus]|uniref:Uncharacterized protein n=1 Tax=Acidithiobacillus marinus TaxID=187490 RepID=A0A2I1DJ64_9PROT|nr:hypothetical protein B1757_12615 [Acidithiobacillus marinus]